MKLRKLAGACTPLARSAIGSVAVRAAAPALNLAVSIVLVRVAGPHNYGIYIYCLAMVGLVLQPVTVGLSTSVIRHLAIYRMRCEWARWAEAEPSLAPFVGPQAMLDTIHRYTCSGDADPQLAALVRLGDGFPLAHRVLLQAFRPGLLRHLGYGRCAGTGP